MNLKKLTGCTTLLCLLLCAILTFTACGGDTQTPTDTQGETIADTSAPTDTQTETQAPAKVTYTFTVKNQDGTPMADVTIALQSRGVKVAEATTNAQGQATIEAVVGSYTVDYVILPENYSGDAVNLELTEDNTSIDLTIQDITPNGEADRPYVITQDTTPITLPAGATVHYIFYGGMNRYLFIENTTATITHKDQTYTPDADGNLKVDLVTDGPRDPITFAINNPSDADMEVTLLVLAVLGSMDRPVEITQLDEVITATVPKESAIYYKWVATTDGILMVTSSSEMNNIIMTNSRNSAASYFTEGSACEYLVVKTGDEVVIAVGSRSTDAQSEIPFAIKVMAGNESDPVVMGKDKMSLHFDANTTYTYSYTPKTEVAKVLTVTGANISVVVTGDETQYATEENGGSVTITLPAGSQPVVLTITHHDKETGGEVTIEVTDKTE